MKTLFNLLEDLTSYEGNKDITDLLIEGEAIKTKAGEFLSDLETDHVFVTDHIQLEDIDTNNAFECIYNAIDENNGFDVEIIYYSCAMEYLSKNDISLNESLEIASELCFEVQNLNSEILASLLASKNERENFYDLETEINDFFEDIESEISDFEDKVNELIE